MSDTMIVFWLMLACTLAVVISGYRVLVARRRCRELEVLANDLERIKREASVWTNDVFVQRLAEWDRRYLAAVGKRCGR